MRIIEVVFLVGVLKFFVKLGQTLRFKFNFLKVIEIQSIFNFNHVFLLDNFESYCSLFLCRYKQPYILIDIRHITQWHNKIINIIS